MEKPIEPLKKGILVQFNPDTVRNARFSGCFMVITESRDSGCYGYIQSIGEYGEQGPQFSYKAKWEEFEVVGHVQWIAEKIYKDEE